MQVVLGLRILISVFLINPQLNQQEAKSDFTITGLISRENSHANPPLNDQKRKVLLTEYFDFPTRQKW